MIHRGTTLKKLFEVSILNGEQDISDAKTLLVVADDQDDAQSVDGITADQVIKLVEVPGLVTTVGPSRVIGWTRAT